MGGLRTGPFPGPGAFSLGRAWWRAKNFGFRVAFDEWVQGAECRASSDPAASCDSLHPWTRRLLSFLILFGWGRARRRFSNFFSVGLLLGGSEGFYALGHFIEKK